jgi:hypothetical protein
MSLLVAQSRHKPRQNSMSEFGGKADLIMTSRDFRFLTHSDKSVQ